MRTLLFLAALAVMGIIWGLDRMAALNLRAELAALRQEHAELAPARRDNERLQQLHTDATRRAAEHRTATAASPTPAVNMTRASAPLVTGEWYAPGSWQNRGRSTPAATIETALWAAGGGDLATLQSLLQLDDAVRAKADALRAQLPVAANAAYASAEQLLAAFATKSLPLGAAQLVWNHQPNADEAFACLFVKNPEHVPPPAPPEPAPPTTREEAIARAEALRAARAKEKQPPMAPPNPATRALYLVLHRSETGWGFVVSPGAIDKIAGEIAGGR